MRRAVRALAGSRRGGEGGGGNPLNLTFNGDFSTGNFSQWFQKQDPPNRRATVVTSPVPAGATHAGRFELQNGDETDDPSGGHRSEVRTDLKLREGDTFYFRNVIRRSGGVAGRPSNSAQTLMQWKNDGTGTAPLDLRVLWSAQYALCDARVTGGMRVYWEGPIDPPADTYTNFLFGVKFSTNASTGWVKVWMNDVQQTMKTGVTGTTLSADGFTLYTDTLRPSLESYLKVGYYSGSTLTYEGIVYHALTRYGPTAEGV